LSFSKTCRFAYNRVAEYKHKAFSIMKTLKRFFEEDQIPKFRHLQSETGTLISGSTALGFFDRTVFPDSDLDMYVEHHRCAAVALSLRDIFGYTYLRRESQPDTLEQALVNTLDRAQLALEGEYNGVGMVEVYNFVKLEGERILKIQLICSARASLELILQYHSSTIVSPTYVVSYIHIYIH
jgi:hypothetical protein